MDALAYEVKLFDLLLVVEAFKFNDPFEEKLVSQLELLMGNLALIHNLDGDDKLAVV